MSTSYKLYIRKGYRNYLDPIMCIAGIQSKELYEPFCYTIITFYYYYTHIYQWKESTHPPINLSPDLLYWTEIYTGNTLDECKQYCIENYFEYFL